ncbi:helix-turn-helix domain-containing protein [Aestuariivirga sp.]|uniref:helix-turn-helix domain-containing protein n=1 Tax=Aestuariivirga sp. TaxID=2650926 RepID=UPI003BAC535A
MNEQEYFRIFDLMHSDDFTKFLIAWRRNNGLRQSDLAKLLGRSQAAISRWEAGIDLPAVRQMCDVQDFLVNRKGRDPFALDVAFVKMQSDCRALFELDGAELLAVSEGFKSVWPDFGQFIGMRVKPHMIGESASIYLERRLSGRIRSGEIGIVSGISERHVDLSNDAPFKHRWILAFRRFAGRTVGEMVYQPCDEGKRLGIERVIAL